jgi:hypothetical protein
MEEKTNKYSRKALSQIRNYLGSDGIRFFSHLKGLTGTVSPVLRLNPRRKGGLTSHPVHLREGRDIRNYMRGLSEFSGFDYDEVWAEVVDLAISVNWNKIK